MPETLFFPFFGPNRRSDKRVVEIRLEFNPGQESGLVLEPAEIVNLLLEAGIIHKGEAFPYQPLPAQRPGWYSSLLGQSALLFQQKAGHSVDYVETVTSPESSSQVVLVEHEHSGTGTASVQLAQDLFNGELESLAESFREFSEFAAEHLLPAETRAIIKAAAERGIPCFQLEHEPLSGHFKIGFRVRKNGLLLLGHGRSAHILDGTFCVDRAGEFEKALLRNPGQRHSLLQQLGLPVSQSNVASSGEAHGTHYSLLVVNRQLTATEETPGGQVRLLENVHPDTATMALAVSEKLGFAPVSLSVVCADLSKPLATSGGVVRDFDLAPGLELESSGETRGKTSTTLTQQLASSLIDGLFPGQGDARMPSIAVTGSNGKTTAVRMINHILMKSGKSPGMVCTDGIFLNGEQISHTDAGAFIGHARVLTSQRVDSAVLETHHRGITIRGFAFDRCDIAVCLNVTEEHLQVGEIETVDEMTVIKRALVERGSKGVVLFADDPNCRSMVDFITAEKICLVSLLSDQDQLSLLVDRQRGCYCVLEVIEGEQWIVFHDDQDRLPLMPVNQIPATMDGTATFNISNAMHAAAATWLSGTGLETIRSALAVFRASAESTPGRLNVYDDLPFRVIIDFAHNPDGMKKICAFTDKQPVSGRKIIAFSGSGKRVAAINRVSAQAVAGHFDYYFCKDYQPSEPPKRRYVASFMQQVLIEEGVPAADTEVLTFGKDVIFRIFDFCEPGDLLLLLLGHTEKETVPGYIREYAARR